ncbi:hypothetical protein ACHAW6_001150 [Cyclotella cf. meneghiniana]
MCCHVTFDVDMEDFCHKAWIVAGGHMTKAPATLTYASIMSQETMQTALLVAVLKFGDDCGQKAIIVRALYGLKSSGAAFRAHLASCLHETGYHSYPTESNLWLKEQTDGWVGVTTPVSSVMQMTCLWSSITLSASWTRMTVSFPSNLTHWSP